MNNPYFSLIVAGLFIFGIFYNWLVGVGERKKWLEGYTALAVVIGTLVTLGAMAMIDVHTAVTALILFAASGTPMLAGSIARYIQARHREREYERQTPRMAERGKDRQG